MKMTVWRSAKRAGGSCFEASKVRYIQRMAELFLGRAKFTANSPKPLPNCPKSENLKLLPSRVQSAVSEDAFQALVSAFGGMDPALTKENMNDLCLVCEGFGFAALCSQASVLDEEVRWRGCGAKHTTRPKP
jgi:hypothetical protein